MRLFFNSHKPSTSLYAICPGEYKMQFEKTSMKPCSCLPLHCVPASMQTPPKGF